MYIAYKQHAHMYRTHRQICMQTHTYGILAHVHTYITIYTHTNTYTYILRHTCTHTLTV
jgi:hypothetical protein